MVSLFLKLKVSVPLPFSTATPFPAFGCITNYVKG